MAHIGEKLALVLACLCELAALVLDFIEQAYVLDRNRGLVGKSFDQLDLLVGEWAYVGAAEGQHAYWDALAQHGNSEHGANPGPSPVESKVRIGIHIEDVNSTA